MKKESRRVPHRPRLLEFPSHLQAIKCGRPLRPDYDSVHVAILQALDEVRGVTQVQWLCGQPITAALMRQWLLAQRRLPILGGRYKDAPLFRKWMQG